MQRRYLPFDGSWSMQVDLPVSLAVSTAGNVWTCGQCDLDASGRARNDGDLDAQTSAVMEHLLRVLHDGGAANRTPLFVHACYVTDGSVDEQAWREHLLGCLPAGTDAVLALTPLQALGYAGMATEIDAVAASQEAQPPEQPASKMQSLRARLLDACRLGALVYTADVDAPGTGAPVAAALAQLGRALETCDTDLTQVVRLELAHDPHLALADVDAAESALAAGLREAGATTLPVLVRVPKPHLPARGRLRLHAVALAGDAAREPRRMIATDEVDWRRPGAADWPHALAVDGRVFVGMQLPLDASGRVRHDGDMAAQTRLVMDRMQQLLAAFGAGCQDLAKMHTWYVGGAGADDLHATLCVRAGYFRKPACPSTGLPLPGLSPPGALVMVDGIAVPEIRT